MKHYKLTEQKKKKFKARTTKKFLKSEKQIEQIDPSTYDVKSQSEEGRTYMVYNSINEGWLCDCMWFSIHMNHKAPHPECKHIKMVYKLIGIEVKEK